LRRLDVAFHTYIYKLADHEFMFQVWENLTAISNRIWYVTSQIYFSKLEEVAKLHKPILDALTERDQEKSIESFLVHMNHIWEKKFDYIDKINN